MTASVSQRTPGVTRLCPGFQQTRPTESQQNQRFGVPCPGVPGFSRAHVCGRTRARVRACVSPFLLGHLGYRGTEGSEA